MSTAAGNVKTIEVPGGRIAYEVTGEGPLVLLSHGMGDDRSAYRFLAPLLSRPGTGSRRWICADTGSRAWAGLPTRMPTLPGTCSR